MHKGETPLEPPGSAASRAVVEFHSGLGLFPGYVLPAGLDMLPCGHPLAHELQNGIISRFYADENPGKSGFVDLSQLFPAFVDAGLRSGIGSDSLNPSEVSLRCFKTATSSGVLIIRASASWRKTC